MTKKIFLLCIAVLLAIQSSASAKKSELPEEDRVGIAVEVIDGSRHKDLNSAAWLESYLAERLVDKKLIRVVGTDNNLIRNEQTSTPENLGALLIFDAVELPPPGDAPADFNQQRYESLGAAYVVRCEILALGLTKVQDSTFGTVNSLIGSGLSLAGSGNKSSDKTLRRVGTGLGLLGFGDLLSTQRTALNTVVNMQFIDVASGKVLWQENFIGQSIKHRKGGKKFDNPWERAFFESVDDSAKIISKRVNKYVDKVIVKGKSDKNFLPKKNPLGGLGVSKPF